MTYQPGISLHKQRDWLTVDGFEPFSIALKPDIVLHYTGHTGKWIGRLTGDRCKGLESWEIDDATGAIKYVGSSTVTGERRSRSMRQPTIRKHSPWVLHTKRFLQATENDRYQRRVVISTVKGVFIDALPDSGRYAWRDYTTASCTRRRVS